MLQKSLKIALLGNPNAGKSSLFNQLTGLNQRIGNFPGVTVDKKVGSAQITASLVADIIDLPGTYSLYPKSLDEQVVFDFLNKPDDEYYPDFLIVIVDASNLKRNLLLFTQIRDLGFPVILALNMLDVATKDGIHIDIDRLSRDLNVPIVPINARTGKGVNQLKAAIACPIHNVKESYFKPSGLATEVIRDIRVALNLNNDYQALQLANQYRNMHNLSAEQKKTIEQITKKHNYDSLVLQTEETIRRYEVIHDIIGNAVTEVNYDKRSLLSRQLDGAFTHKVWGYLIFFCLLFVIFQSIFAFASYPMDLIDQGIALLNDGLRAALPAGALNSLITDGLVAGLGGILIFIPQIAILFAFIAILEESGYMARVMFLMDRIMRPFGMSGKSVVPLISGVACAVPAIMATRGIDSWKERIITIFVTPLMSCSARIPVFTVLIALVVPDQPVLGILNLQGLVLMALYFVGFAAAMLSGLAMSFILKAKGKSYFIMELPVYRVPRWKNVGITIVEKVKAFVFQAGKVILAISIILWVLATFGPGNSIEQAEAKALATSKAKQLDASATNNLIQAGRLEASYAGQFGKFVEPVIRPLGFDWKIGIALITSFAAREVFIGTMATIYSIGDKAEESETVMEKMREEVNPETGGPMYTPALSFSLLIFYLFAMQCMSTLAVVYRETKGWKWPVLQFIYMTALAYISSWAVYTVLS